MFNTIQEFRESLLDKRSTVITLDVECYRCHKISEDAATLYADDVLDLPFTDTNFEFHHHFHCIHCAHDNRFMVKDIRKVKESGSLFEHISHRESIQNLIEMELWCNTLTNRYELIEKRLIKIDEVNNKRYFFHEGDFNFAEWFLSENVENTNHFNVKYDITVSELCKLEFKGSIRPRKCYIIQDSSKLEFVKNCLEMRLDPLLGIYTFSRILFYKL